MYCLIVVRGRGGPSAVTRAIGVIDTATPVLEKTREVMSELDGTYCDLSLHEGKACTGAWYYMKERA